MTTNSTPRSTRLRRSVSLTAIAAAVAILPTAVSAQTTTTPTTTNTGTTTTKPVVPKPKLPVAVKSIISEGRTEVVEVKDVSRIVVLNGDVNEILYALGLGDNIVANDITGYFPAESEKKTKIGYQRSLTAEGILAQKPSLIIGNTDAGPSSTMAQLRSSGVPVVIVAAGDDVYDAAKKNSPSRHRRRPR